MSAQRYQQLLDDLFGTGRPAAVRRIRSARQIDAAVVRRRITQSNQLGPPRIG